MRRGEGRRLLIVLPLALLPATASGYDPQVHQRLTFFAAKTLNECLKPTEVPPLTPLQVRFIANSNMGLANSNALVRFFRWSYFDSADGEDRKVLWFINTRFVNHFEEVAEELSASLDASKRYRDLGRIVSYVQLVTSPSRALPVYAARFWRLSLGDRFDGYPVNERALEGALAGDCAFLAGPPESYRQILDETAADTVAAVRSPIPGLPTTWESFWQPGDEPGDFGDYGPAGNSFGRKVEFPCDPAGPETCVLLEDDPLYGEFALERQLAAVRGTARAMYLHQLRHADDEAVGGDVATGRAAGFYETGGDRSPMPHRHRRGCSRP